MGIQRINSNNLNYMNFINNYILIHYYYFFFFFFKKKKKKKKKNKNNNYKITYQTNW